MSLCLLGAPTARLLKSLGRSGRLPQFVLCLHARHTNTFHHPLIHTLSDPPRRRNSPIRSLQFSKRSFESAEAGTGPMKPRYKSPVRKPVQAATYEQTPVDYSQPQRKLQSMPIEHQMSHMDIHEQESLGAMAENSPGRISGRDRDTAMFDPKRGTYIPYGGFDSIIDEYYTEGDYTELKIPTPSQLQRREQSRSPQRDFPRSSSRPAVSQALTYEDRSLQLPGHGEIRPEMHRKVSGNSAHSSQAGSVHGSPNRGRLSGNNQAQVTQGARVDQSYEDETHYAHGSQPRQQEYQQNYPTAGMPSGAANQRQAKNGDDRQPPRQVNGYPQHHQLDHDGHPSNQTQASAVNYARHPQQLRQQRSMDFHQSRNVPPAGYDEMQPGRRRNMDERDPRPLQQDPRLAPRPHTGNAPNMRQGPPGRMRSSDGQGPLRDDMQRRGQMPPDESRRQQMPQPRTDHRGDLRGDPRGEPRRGPRNAAGNHYQDPSRGRNPTEFHKPISPYPQSPPDKYDQLANDRTRPAQDGRLQSLEQRRPSPAMNLEGRGPQMAPPIRSNTERSERFDEPRQAPNPQMLRQPPPMQNQQSLPPVQQQQQQQQQQYRTAPQRNPMPPQQGQQAVAQRPAPSSVPANRGEDASDMIMHTEPAGKVTLAEINKLRKEAKANNPELQLTLVKRLIEAAAVLADEGGKADPKQTRKNKEEYSREALRTLKQITAQDKPYPEAVFFLANCYGNGALSLEVDHERAFCLYESAAKLQHAASAYRTAVCLEIGAGTRQDVGRAVRFYERAAEYGDPAAMYKIGMILLRGLLDQKADARAAVNWLQKAAEKADIDNPHALHELGLLYEKGDAAAGIGQSETFAKELFTKAAKLHYAPSQFRMGYAYEYGLLGCPVDPRRSIAWFSRGAERGDPESELSLSGWYLTGSEGILAQNDREAYLWGRKAAEKGLAKAEFAVGYFYESGIGTTLDIDEAIKWYKRAATAGQKKAQERLLALGKRKR